jgi:hypothetical protein
MSVAVLIDSARNVGSIALVGRHTGLWKLR